MFFVAVFNRRDQLHKRTQCIEIRHANAQTVLAKRKYPQRHTNTMTHTKSHTHRHTHHNIDSHTHTRIHTTQNSKKPESLRVLHHSCLLCSDQLLLVIGMTSSTCVRTGLCAALPATHARNDTQLNTFTHSVNWRIQTYFHTRPHTHTHTNTNRNTQTHTHTHPYTHKHTIRGGA